MDKYIRCWEIAERVEAAIQGEEVEDLVLLQEVKLPLVVTRPRGLAA